MFRGVPLSIMRSFFTVHTAMVCVRITKELQFRPDPARKLSAKPVWHIPLLCVQRKTPDDGQRNCPKHVEFYSKNKFENLVHLVGFIIRIYHDSRSPARQIGTDKSMPSLRLQNGICVGRVSNIHFCIYVNTLKLISQISELNCISFLRAT